MVPQQVAGRGTALSGACAHRDAVASVGETVRVEIDELPFGGNVRRFVRLLRPIFLGGFLVRGREETRCTILAGERELAPLDFGFEAGLEEAALRGSGSGKPHGSRSHR